MTRERIERAAELKKKRRELLGYLESATPRKALHLKHRISVIEDKLKELEPRPEPTYRVVVSMICEPIVPAGDHGDCPLRHHMVPLSATAEEAWQLVKLLDHLKELGA